MGKFLRDLVTNQESVAGRRFDLCIQSLIIISVIAFSYETLPGLSPVELFVLHIVEVFTVVVFTVEYLARVYFSEQRLRFIFSIGGLIDLVAIAPFYLALGVDLRSIRLFRLLRLIRLFKLSGYGGALRRFGIAISAIRAELLMFGLITVMCIWLTAVGIYYFESEAQPESFGSIFHSMWWALATLTTVGYGDVYPITVGGKVFTFFILMIGLSLVAVPSGLLAAALTSVAKNESDIDE